MTNKKKPSEWTKEDLERIFEAMSTLQEYDLDTSSTTMNLCHVMPEHLNDE